MFKRLILAIALAALSSSAGAVLTCYIPSIGANTTWYVGNQFQGADTAPEYCWANGAELAYIQQHFTGLRGRTGPNVNGAAPLVVWTDPADAEFIVNNL